MNENNHAREDLKMYIGWGKKKYYDVLWMTPIETMREYEYSYQCNL